MSEYSNLRSLAELERAQKKIASKIEGKKRHLRRDTDKVQAMFAPMNLISSGLQAVAPVVHPVDSALLSVVRKLKKKLL